jgi:hypothetical protein
MQRTERKNPRLKARVEALDRELAQMNEEIRVMSRAAEHPDRESAMRRLRQLAAEQERTREIPVNRAPGRLDGVERERGVAPISADPSGLGAPGGNPPETVSRGGADSRFANYFVTGSLHSIQPLRQERRLQRNKALVMLFFAMVLLYGVFSLIF